MRVKVTRCKKDLTYDDAREWIFSDNDFFKEFNLILEKQNIDELEAREECEGYLKEIAARYTKNRLFWDIMEILVRKRIMGSFENVYYNKDGVKLIKNLARKHIVNVVPNHRSVFDFMILSYILVKETTYMPIILAADVFTTFPLGLIFRRNGTYFVRREVDNELYSLVFKYYVMMISKCELLHMFFIEGGRNKTGNYSEPKKGILKYMLDGAKKYSNSDVAFVPISISYDFVPESKVVIEENKSGKRKHIFESMASYIFKSNLGNCYIKFGKPIKVSEFKKSIKNKNTVDKLGDHLIEIIKSLVIVSPTALICYTLFNYNKIKYEDFKKRFKNNYEVLSKYKSDVSSIEVDKINEYLKFVDDKGIIVFDKGKGIINIDPKKKPIVEYYRNNILHLFKS